MYQRIRGVSRISMRFISCWTFTCMSGRQCCSPCRWGLQGRQRMRWVLFVFRLGCRWEGVKWANCIYIIVTHSLWRPRETRGIPTMLKWCQRGVTSRGMLPKWPYFNFFGGLPFSCLQLQESIGHFEKLNRIEQRRLLQLVSWCFKISNSRMPQNCMKLYETVTKDV